MDLFEEYLNKREKSVWVKRALTDNSLKNTKTGLTKKDVNKELATYGDALLKFCYACLLLDNYKDKKSLSKAIEKYISDEILVTVIAEKYKLINFIDYDKDDVEFNRKIKLGYKYIMAEKTKGGNKKTSPSKYLATAVEAMVGAIYKEKENFENAIEAIIPLIKSWKELIDKYYSDNQI